MPRRLAVTSTQQPVPGQLHERFCSWSPLQPAAHCYPQSVVALATPLPCTDGPSPCSRRSGACPVAWGSCSSCMN